MTGGRELHVFESLGEIPEDFEREGTGTMITNADHVEEPYTEIKQQPVAVSHDFVSNTKFKASLV